MTFQSSDFIVSENSTFNLSDRLHSVAPLYSDKQDYEKQLSDNVEHMRDLQRMLYAHNHHALLLVFQAMDAAGKDGTIRHVMSGINPQGFQVFSFKQPSREELEHDFLWRTTKRLPERGRIGVFNRSYYEEVLVVRVHPEYLQGQNLPKETLNNPDIWQERYQSIREFEAHIHKNGTKVVKFFLNVSKEEQKNRFIARIDEPEKNWKFSKSDIAERQHWDAYMQAYETCLRATSSTEAPWYVIPADDKKNARLIVSNIVKETLESLDMHYPKVSDERREQLQEIRTQLLEE